MLLTNRKWFCDHTNHCFLGLFDEFIIDILWRYRSIVLIFHDQKIIFLLFPLSFQTIRKIIQFCKDLTNDKSLIRSDWFHLNFCNSNANIDRIATQSVMSKSFKHCLGSHSTHSTYIPLLPLISLWRQTPLFVTWMMWNNENVNITGSYSWRNWAVKLWSCDTVGRSVYWYLLMISYVVFCLLWYLAVMVPPPRTIQRWTQMSIYWPRTATQQAGPHTPSAWRQIINSHQL